MNKKAEKKESARRASTRQLIGAKAVTEYSLLTYGHGELVFFLVKPRKARRSISRTWKKVTSISWKSFPAAPLPKFTAG